jgi:glyoxylase-like metal-dependent hydrolase (beta-lactamase superfamily II)
VSSVADGGLQVRVVSLHPDVILLTSAVWQTNCTIVRAGEECFVIDSPLLPEELHALPAVLEQTGLRISGLLATHGDWDHLLGRLAFPQASLGCAQTTAARLHAAPGEAQRELRAFDEQYYVERPQPLGLGSLQELPVPGCCGIGVQEIELHAATGHTVDGMAVWIPWAAALVAGDYLSAIEIPFFGEGRGSLGAYRATLQQLRPLVERAEHVVPGHGPVLDSTRALAVLEEDLAYLQELEERGAEAQLPPGRRSKAQRQLHAQNVAGSTEGEGGR